MFDVQYFVDEEKKIVVAKITDAGMSLVCEMCKMGYHNTPLEVRDAYVGKAKCSPDDTFDLEKGKKIAFKRAFIKYTTVKQKELTSFVKWVNERHDEFIKDTNKLIVKYDSAIERRYTEIETLISE